MDLIQTLQQAIANKDKSKLAELESHAQRECEPLLACGQKNHAAIVYGLLQELKDQPVEVFVPRAETVVTTPPSGLVAPPLAAVA